MHVFRWFKMGFEKCIQEKQEYYYQTFYLNYLKSRVLRSLKKYMRINYRNELKIQKMLR